MSEPTNHNYLAVTNSAVTDEGEVQPSMSGTPLTAVALLAVADAIRDLTRTISSMSESS